MQMKPSSSLLAFLLILVVTTAQGIRFKPGSISPSDDHKEIQEKGSSIKESAAVGTEVVICTDGHCSGRSTRKLVTMTQSTSESAKNKGVKVEASTAPNNVPSSKVESHDHSENLDIKPPISEHRKSAADEHYPDIIDIAGMDYSPAKRKPPIHN